jgi:hypothetical protein
MSSKIIKTNRLEIVRLKLQLLLIMYFCGKFNMFYWILNDKREITWEIQSITESWWPKQLPVKTEILFAEVWLSMTVHVESVVRKSALGLACSRYFSFSFQKHSTGLLICQYLCGRPKYLSWITCGIEVKITEATLNFCGLRVKNFFIFYFISFFIFYLFLFFSQVRAS